MFGIELAAIWTESVATSFRAETTYYHRRAIDWDDFSGAL